MQAECPARATYVPDRRVRSGICVTLLLAIGCAPGGQEEPVAGDVTSEPQAISLFGEPLYAQVDTTGAIAEADAALAEAPDDVELLLAAGRVRRNFWQYRQAMELYSRVIELEPDDWRAYRYRGHRHISLRQFDAAILDLEAARTRAPLNWDVSYHLGLAYYLDRRFSEAADEYTRCLDLAGDVAARAAQTDDFRSCSQNAVDPESLVAMTEWATRAAYRAGRAQQAEALLEGIPEDLVVEENVAYYHDLLFYKGLKTADELLNPGPDAPYRRETVGYGVASMLIVRGDTADAVALLEELVQDPWWPGFGRIAAEVELARLTSSSDEVEEARRTFDRDRLIQVAREIMTSARYCALVTLDAGGAPHVRAMDPFEPDEAVVVWLATRPSTRKVEEIRGNDRVALYYFDADSQGYVTLTGSARLVDDPGEKARRWKEEWAAFYPDRALDYLLVQVIPDRVEVVSVAHGIEGGQTDWRPPTVIFGDAS